MLMEDITNTQLVQYQITLVYLILFALGFNANI